MGDFLASPVCLPLGNSQAQWTGQSAAMGFCFCLGSVGRSVVRLKTNGASDRSVDQIAEETEENSPLQGTTSLQRRRRRATPFASISQTEIQEARKPPK